MLRSILNLASFIVLQVSHNYYVTNEHRLIIVMYIVIMVHRTTSFPGIQMKACKPQELWRPATTGTSGPVVRLSRQKYVVKQIS